MQYQLCEVLKDENTILVYHKKQIKVFASGEQEGESGRGRWEVNLIRLIYYSC